MTDEQIKILVTSCRAARRARKPARFFYCQKGAEDEPLLLISRKITAAQIQEIRRAAKVRVFARGTVQSSRTGLVFRTKSPENTKLRKHLKSFYALKVPALKKARVLGLDEEDVESSEEDVSQALQETQESLLSRRESLTALSLEREAASASVAEARARFDAVLQDIEAARQAYLEACEEEGLSQQDVEAAEEKLPGFFGALFRSHEESHVLREEYEAAQRKLAESREQLERRKAALDQLQQAAEDAQDAIDLAIQEDVALIAEVREREGVEALARDQQSLAQDRVNQATREEEEAEDALWAAIDAHPGFAEAAEEVHKTEATADAHLEEVLAQQDALGELQELRQTLAAVLVEEDPPSVEGLEEMAALEEQIKTQQAELDRRIVAAELVDQAARRKRISLQRQVRERSASDPALAALLQAKHQAGVRRNELVSQEADCDRAVIQAEEDLEDAKRRQRIQLQVAQTRTLLESSRYIYADLAEINPRDPESVAEHASALENGGLELFSRTQEMYAELVEQGATPDELSALFADVPSAWRPDALTDHMVWFQKLEEWQAAMADTDEAHKMQVSIEKQLNGEDPGGKMDQFQAKLTALFDNTDDMRKRLIKLKGASASTVTGAAEEMLLEEIGLDTLRELRTGDTIKQMAKIMGIVNSGVGVVTAGFDVRDAHKNKHKVSDDVTLSAELQGDEDYDQTQDPLLQRMMDEQLLAAVAKLGDKGFSLLVALSRSALPELGLAAAGKNLVKAVMEASHRIAEAIQADALLDEAEEQGHVAAEALRQTRNNEAKLAAKASVDVAIKSLKAAGGVGRYTGAGAAFSFATAMSASATSMANNTVHAVVDFRLAAKAQEYLEQARAGLAEGARKLFEYSRTHAKGMLAWMATQGDPIAKKYATVQGVSEEELSKTCPAVLQRFLLRTANEEGSIDTFSEWLDKKVAAWKETLATIREWVARLTRPVVDFFKDVLCASPPELPGVVAVPAELISAMSETLSDFAEKRAFLLRKPRENRKMIAALDAERDTLDAQADEERARVSENLKQIAAFRADADWHLRTDQTRGGEPLGGARRAYFQRLSAHLVEASRSDLELMNQLAMLA